MKNYFYVYAPPVQVNSIIHPNI